MIINSPNIGTIQNNNIILKIGSILGNISTKTNPFITPLINSQTLNQQYFNKIENNIIFTLNENNCYLDFLLDFNTTFIEPK